MSRNQQSSALLKVGGIFLIQGRILWIEVSIL
jgi:hypothetical protein